MNKVIYDFRAFFSRKKRWRFAVKLIRKEYGRPHCAHLELAKGAMAARAAVARLTVSKHDYHFIN